MIRLGTPTWPKAMPGRLASVSPLRSCSPELSGYRFVTTEDASVLLRSDVHDRLVRAQAVLADGTTNYGETYRSS